ncbi:MAG: hypothetical protein RLZZ517_343 [Candidatus Parcubacteria bacterium]|jgi:uncharacterized membrane protein YhaH (DUF805 family)
MKKFFGLKGGFSRKNFIIGFLGDLALYLIIETLFSIYKDKLNVALSITPLIFVYVVTLFLLLFCAFYLFVFSIKRLRDLNRSPWFCLLILVPVFNIFFIATLCFAEGRIKG